jgi:hypothetical protein
VAAVLLNVLPNARVKIVGPGAVRAVVIAGLVEAVATDEIAIGGWPGPVDYINDFEGRELTDWHDGLGPS